MRSKSLILLVSILTIAGGLFIATAQESDDEVRGAFLSTRPKTTNTNAPSRRRRTPHNTNTGSTNSSDAKNANTSAKNANTGSAKNTNGRTSSRNANQAIALGYTLFMRDANGRGVRVEPSREFHSGDRVRIALEPNVDGYLYVFHTEGDGIPEMIYPDARLDGGNNEIEAHVPMEVPSSDEPSESLRWFQFDNNAATEHLFVVVTREPLPSVPTDDDLVGFCAANKDKCPWHPSDLAWMQIQDATTAEVKVNTDTKTFGRVQSEKEKIATTRGLGLDKSAPQPSVIRMNASTSAPLLVAVLDLVHK